MNKKTIIILAFASVVAIGIFGTLYLLKKNIKPLVGNNDVLKSCADNGICEEGYICYHSQYGGTGPNGTVAIGKEFGDLLCHKLCVSDNDCGIEKCKTVGIFGGDIEYNVKFCSEK